MSIDKLLTSVVSPAELENVDNRRREQTIHQYTYGISTDPWVHFSVGSKLVHFAFRLILGWFTYDRLYSLH